MLSAYLREPRYQLVATKHILNDGVFQQVVAEDDIGGLVAMFEQQMLQ